MQTNIHPPLRAVFCWLSYAVLFYGVVAYASGWEWSVSSFIKHQPHLLPLYGLLLLLMPVWPSYLVAPWLAAWVWMLSEISAVKSKAIKEPLVYSDLFQAGQAVHLSTYTNPILLAAAALAAALSVVLLVYLFRHRRLQSSPRAKLVAGVIIFGVCCFPYFTSQFAIKERVADLFHRAFEIRYRAWHPDRSYTDNGLPFHLILTSSRYQVKEYGAEEIARFEAGAPRIKKPFSDAPPQKIFLILCEACWADKRDGYAPLNPLLAQGFAITDMIAPTYGGGTANGEFEMLMSLPSRRLSGTIYQEYYKDIAEGAVSLPQQLKAQGYATVALHNFKRSFWHRDLIYPKIGFDRFIGLEDMAYQDEGFEWPGDRVLYDSIKKAMAGHKNDKLFVFGITVFTHGMYKDNNQDGGAGDYFSRLKVTVDELAQFAAHIKRTEKDYVMIVFGDHKPWLSKYYVDQGIFPSTFFRETGATSYDFVFEFGMEQHHADIGRVPVMVMSSSKGAGYKAFVDSLKDKPFFCMTPLLGQWLDLGLDEPAFDLGAQLCTRGDLGYTDYAPLYPEILYSRNIFHVPKTR